MTIELTQVNALPTSLAQNSTAPNYSDLSFDHYLDEEKKRLSLLFSPFSGFDFSSLFGYAPSTESKKQPIKIELFADQAAPKEAQTNKAPATSQNTSNSTSQISSQPQTTAAATNSIQNLIKNSGLLVPNLEAKPFFFQLQTENSLLPSFDLQSLVDELVSQIKIIKENGASQINISLSPKDLGELVLTLTEKSGMISIQIQASDEAKKQLESEKGKLLLALKKANINIGQLTIIAAKEATNHDA